MVGVHKGTGLFDLLNAGNFQLLKETIELLSCTRIGMEINYCTTECSDLFSLVMQACNFTCFRSWIQVEKKVLL
jgi:hypothetical protein